MDGAHKALKPHGEMIELSKQAAGMLGFMWRMKVGWQGGERTEQELKDEIFTVLMDGRALQS